MGVSRNIPGQRYSEMAAETVPVISSGATPVGIVGTASKGVLNEMVRIGSQRELIDVFGALKKDYLGLLAANEYLKSGK